MAKSNRNTAAPVDPRVCRILASNMFYQTLENFSTNVPALTALKAFIEQKRKSPLQSFGGKDYPFKGGDIKGYLHAGLTHDVFIVYTISGKNPNIITLYGVFTHDQLGTGNPPNQKRQSQAAKQMNNQDTFKAYGKVDETAR